LIVREECLNRFSLTVAEAAEGLGVTRQTLNNLVNGKAGLSATMAMRLAKAFGGTAQEWLHLQVIYDLAQVQEAELQVRRYSIEHSLSAQHVGSEPATPRPVGFTGVCDSGPMETAERVDACQGLPISESLTREQDEYRLRGSEADPDERDSGGAEEEPMSDRRPDSPPPDYDPEVRDRIARLIEQMCATGGSIGTGPLKNELSQVLFGRFARYENAFWDELYERAREGQAWADAIAKFEYWKRRAVAPHGAWYESFGLFTVCGNGAEWTGLLFDGEVPHGEAGE
jgi:addiction module HigA family antidote